MVNKLRAIKCTVAGIQFDSKSESKRYSELKLLERTGTIKNLELQKRYELIPKQKLSNGKTERACHYLADFVYEMNGQSICEDRKGFITKDYVIKRKLMKFIHDIEILETKDK